MLTCWMWYKRVDLLSIFTTKVEPVLKYIKRKCRGRDRMVVGFTTTYAIGDYHLDVVWSIEYQYVNVLFEIVFAVFDCFEGHRED